MDKTRIHLWGEDMIEIFITIIFKTGLLIYFLREENIRYYSFKNFILLFINAAVLLPIHIPASTASCVPTPA